MATLLKKTHVQMVRTEVFPDQTACFEQLDDPSMPRPIRSAFLPKELQDELGNPDVITIIVEAGIHKKENK